MAIKFGEFFANLDKNANVRGNQFERAAKWWLENDPVWSSIVDKVWHWNEWPDANGRDIGIDLVAKDREGKFYAVQVKAYDPESNLKKSDIDSFLSASSQKIFSTRLLLTTTKFIGTNAKRALEDQEKPVHVVDWNRLEASIVDWSGALADKKSDKTQQKQLFEHQKDAIQKVSNEFKSADRGQLIMACGTGKTLTGLRIQEKIGGDLSVLLVPSLTLLSQTLNDWLTDRTKDFKWIAICSDESVANDPQDNVKLIDFDFPVTTKKSEIEKFLAEPGRKVVFSTYQSSKQLAAALKSSKIKVDLLLADEAHRIAGKTQSDFASMIIDPQVQVEKRLFLTATPRVFTSSAITKAAEVGISTLSMDDHKVFGKVFYRYDFPKAIKEKVLCDYRVVIIGVDEREIESSIRERLLVNAGSLNTDFESLAIHIAVSKAMKKWNLRRLISFHSRVSKARNFAENQEFVDQWVSPEFASGFELTCETVSSGMPTATRRRSLDKIKKISPKQAVIISNARCLTEGIDVPTLDGVIFVDPRSSQVDIIQAVGRAIRRGGAGKTHGTILLPVVLPKDEELVDATLKTSAYSAIWSVLNALRAHDSSFGDEIDQMRQSLGARKSISEKPSKLIWDIPRTVNKSVAERIKAVAIRNASDYWEEAFASLQHFKDQYGHSTPKQQFVTEDGLKLGIWLSSQRVMRNKGLLEPEREQKLEALGIHWDILDAAWEQGFDLASDYFKEHGHLNANQHVVISNVQNIATGEKDFRLGQWLAVQAQNKRNGVLSKARQERLDSIGIVWNRIEDRWSREIEELDAFRSQEGRWPDNRKDLSPSGFEIGQWFANQIARFRNGTLDEFKIRDLENRGLSKSKKVDQRWETIYLDLVTFKKENGHSRVTKKHYGKSGFELYGWCKIQREAEALGKLDSDKKAKLDALGFSWKTGNSEVDNRKEAVWFERLNDAKNFYKENGHCLIPYNYETPDGIKLGGWVNIQRAKYRNGELANDRVKMLNEIDFVWEPNEQAWYNALSKFEAYKARTGSTKISLDYKDADDQYTLGAWVSKQSKLLKSGKLDKKQAEALKAVLGDF